MVKMIVIHGMMIPRKMVETPGPFPGMIPAREVDEIATGAPDRVPETAGGKGHDLESAENVDAAKGAEAVTGEVLEEAAGVTDRVIDPGRVNVTPDGPADAMTVTNLSPTQVHQLTRNQVTQYKFGTIAPMVMIPNISILTEPSISNNLLQQQHLTHGHYHHQ